MQPPSTRPSAVDDHLIEAKPGIAGLADARPAKNPSQLFFRPGPGWLDTEGRKVGRERAALDAAQRALAATLSGADAPRSPNAATIAKLGTAPVAGAPETTSGPKLFFRSTPGWRERKGGRYRAPLSRREHQLVAETARETAADPVPLPGGPPAKANVKELARAATVEPPQRPVAPATTAPSLSAPSLAALAPAPAKPLPAKPSSASATPESATSTPAPPPSVASPTQGDGGSTSTLAPTPPSALASARPVASEGSPEPEFFEAPPVAAPPTPILSTPPSAPAPAIPDAAPTPSRRPLSEPKAPAPAFVADSPLVASAPEPELPHLEAPHVEVPHVESPKLETPEPLPSASTDRAAKPASLSAPRNGQPDDLKVVKGIGPKTEAICYALGVHHIDQIAAWSTANVVWVGHHIAFPGRIEREGWIDQAKLLSIGFDTPHAIAVRAGTIVVDEAADAPLSDAEVAALREAMPALSATLEDEHKYPGLRPVGLAAAHGGIADDLQRIRGIGRQNEARLRALGIWHFVQIAAWTPDHVKWMGSYLAFPGRIAREAWISQAAALAAGGSSSAPKPRNRRDG